MMMIIIKQWQIEEEHAGSKWPILNDGKILNNYFHY
jgi:hypothetical protein